MTTEEQAVRILDVIASGQEATRALYDAVLALDKRITALEARLAEARASGTATVLN